MNRSLGRTFSLAALLAVGASSTARADFVATNVCGGSNFSTCASVDIKWTNNNNTATVLVTNIGSPGDIFTAIGLTGLTSTQAGNYTVRITQVDLIPNDGVGVDPTANWVKGTQGLSGDGIQSRVAGAVNSGPVRNGLNDGYSLQLVFQFNEAVNTNRAGVAIHAQSGPGDCSSKIVFNANGAVAQNAPTGGYTGCGASTVPEPATIGLLTTGLLGLGGAGFFRRRKKA